jgi:penicillin-insensitive murein endopeptidase
MKIKPFTKLCKFIYLIYNKMKSPCKKGKTRDRVTKLCRKKKTPGPKRKSPKRKSPKRRSPKRKSPKRRSPKRKSPKRRSPKSRSPKRRSLKSRYRNSRQLTLHEKWQIDEDIRNARKRL